jgi:hypothetical protein
LGKRTFAETYGKVGKNQAARLREEFNEEAVAGAMADAGVGI